MSLNLLKSWPSWQKANAETVFASPAWRMVVSYDGKEAILRRADERPADVLGVEITLDGEPHLLAFVDSPGCPDLHLLWSKRADLPPEILLALVEKECGHFFQFLEDTLRKSLAVKGLATTVPADLQTFEMRLGDASLVFALSLSPAVLMTLGKLENLDTAHDSIRALARPARAEYPCPALASEDFASLAPGDRLLLPADFPAGAHWVADDLAEGAAHLVASEPAALTFAQIADDALPPVPAPTALTLFRGPVPFAAVTLSRLGLSPSVTIDSVL